MFIKLTRIDGRPIWINPSFVVTIEARKDGGSIVVPMGDGLDYDIKESVETVIGLCDGTPAPVASEPAAEHTTKRTRKATKKAPDEQPQEGAPTFIMGEQVLDSSSAPVPVMISLAKPEPEPAAKAEPAPEARPAPEPEPRKRTSRGRKPRIDLTDEQMAHLQKLAPSSRQKLLNTLAHHMKAKDPEAIAVALIAHKVIEITPQNHVNWLVK